MIVSRYSLVCFLIGSIAGPTCAHAVIIITDLQGDANYSNRTPAIPNVGETEELRFTLPQIQAGNISVSPEFLIDHYLGDNIREKRVGVIPQTGTLEFAVLSAGSSGLLEFTEGQTIDNSANWSGTPSSSSGSLMFTRQIVSSIGGTTNSGDFGDGSDAFTAFRIFDGANAYYGYIQVSVVNYDTLTVAGFAFDNVPNNPVVVAAIPESSNLAFLFGLIALCLQIGRAHRVTPA